MLNKLTSNLFYLPFDHDTDRPNLGCVVGQDFALLIDAGNSPMHAKCFLDSVLQTIDVPIKYVVITHWHWDHVFGLQSLPFHSIGQELTQEKLKWMQTLSWEDVALDLRVQTGEEIAFCRDMIKKEMPSRHDLTITLLSETYEDTLTINLGNQLVELHHIESEHAKDSTIIYIPNEKVLFLSDCLSPDLYSGEWSYSFSKLKSLLQKIKTFEVDMYLEGHHIPETKEEFWSFFNELLAIGAIVSRARDKEKGYDLFYQERKIKPTEEQQTLIQYFVNGNIKEFADEKALN